MVPVAKLRRGRDRARGNPPAVSPRWQCADEASAQALGARGARRINAGDAPPGTPTSSDVPGSSNSFRSGGPRSPTGATAAPARPIRRSTARRTLNPNGWRSSTTTRSIQSTRMSSTMRPTPLLNLYATEDRWEDGHRVLWKIYDDSPPSEHPQILNLRMKSEMERINPSQSIVHIRKYVAADPTDWETLRALAHAERLLGQLPAAIDHIKECLQQRPDSSPAWVDYLLMLQEAGDQKGVAEAIAKLPPSTESEAEVWKLAPPRRRTRANGPLRRRHIARRSSGTRT